MAWKFNLGLFVLKSGGGLRPAAPLLSCVASARVGGEDGSELRQGRKSKPHSPCRAGPFPSKNRKNKTGIKRSPSEWDPICTNVSEDEVLQAVENARKVELGVGSLGWAKNIWKPKPPHFNKQGVRRLILRCPFRGATNADCCALLPCRPLCA